MGRDVPGKRSIAQSYVQFGGTDVVLVLFTNSFKSKYCDRADNRTGKDASSSTWKSLEDSTAGETEHLEQSHSQGPELGSGNIDPHISYPTIQSYV